MEVVVHNGELEELEVEENAYSVELGEEVENAWGVVGIHDSRQEMEVVEIVDGRRVMVEVGMEVVAAEYNEQVGMGMGEIEKVDSRQEVGRVMEGVEVEVEVEKMLMGVVVTEVAEMVMGVGARVVGVEEEEMVVDGEEIAMM